MWRGYIAKLFRHQRELKSLQSEVAQLRSEVAQLRSEVAQLRSEVAQHHRQQQQENEEFFGYLKKLVKLLWPYLPRAWEWVENVLPCGQHGAVPPAVPQDPMEHV